MAIKIELSDSVNCPIEKVFGFLTNFENNPQWEPGVLEAHQVSAGPMRVGSQLSDARMFMGRRMETQYEVVGYDFNRRFAVKSLSGPMQLQASYVLEPAAGGTKITDTAEFELKGVMKLLEPLFKRMVEQQIRANFAQLKQVLEVNAGTSASA